MLSNDLLNALLTNETNVEDALNRFLGDKILYINVLNEFPNDKTILNLENAIRNESWDDAFTAAHALKGLAGNLGFTPLFHMVGELVISIRTGRIKDIGNALNNVKREYDNIIYIIKNYTN